MFDCKTNQNQNYITQTGCPYAMKTYVPCTMQSVYLQSTKEFTLVQKYPCISGSNWNLGMLVLRRGVNRSTWRKASQSRVENQQQTQPTYDAGSGNQTWETMAGGERCHHCAIPAPFFSEILETAVLLVSGISQHSNWNFWLNGKCLESRRTLVPLRTSIQSSRKSGIVNNNNNNNTFIRLVHTLIKFKKYIYITFLSLSAFKLVNSQKSIN